MVVAFLAIYLNKLNSLSTTEVGIIIGVAFLCKKAGSLLGGVLSDYVHVKNNAFRSSNTNPWLSHHWFYA